MPDLPELDPALFTRLVALRRDIHQHPELSFEEHRTGDLLAKELTQLGLTPRRAARTGLVADVGSSDGPIVALRADLDALPIQEQTGLPFASKHAGVMHACGHDGHAALLLGAAALLCADPPRAGRVRLIFQPAEEKGNGAALLCDEGHMDGVSAIFGAHLDRLYRVGQIVAQAGPVNSGTRTFTIRVQGKGGHGARPSEGVDALLIGAEIVLALQSIVSRELHPTEVGVVTVGSFRAGSRHNVLAGEAKLVGTIRAFDAAVMQQIERAIGRIAAGIAKAHRGAATVELGEGVRPVLNDPAMAELSAEVVRDLLGDDGLATMPRPNMGGEDFCFYLEHAPACYVRLGAQHAGRENAPAHSDRFDFDEAAIAVGARYFEAVARRAIEHFGG